MRDPGPDHLVARAQAGDREAREALIRDFQPFVLRVVSAARGGYVTISHEEASVGLVAFNEAIDSYRSGQGAGFLVFCEMVIRRRLIDHYRQQVRRSRELPLSALEQEDEEGEIYCPAELRAAREAHQAWVESWERREEVTRFGARLRELGLSWRELARVSPRHRDARQRALEVARFLAAHPELGRSVLARRELPVRELQARLGVGRKMLERNRKYILALTVIYLEEFPYLKEYLDR